MDGQRFWATVVLLELFGASITSFTYLTSFAFAKHSMAQVGTILLNFLFGLILVIVSIVMVRSFLATLRQHNATHNQTTHYTTPPQTFIPTTRNVARKLVYVFRLVPSYGTRSRLHVDMR
jgi:hypothetical protein